MTGFLQLFLNCLVLSANYILLAVGLTLIFGILRTLNFAHGSLYIVGAYIVYALFKMMGVNYFLAMVAAIIGVAGLGVFLEAAILFPMTKQKSFLTSLGAIIGVSMVIEGASFIYFSGRGCNDWLHCDWNGVYLWSYIVCGKNSGCDFMRIGHAWSLCLDSKDEARNRHPSIGRKSQGCQHARNQHSIYPFSGYCHFFNSGGCCWSNYHTSLLSQPLSGRPLGVQSTCHCGRGRYGKRRGLHFSGPIDRVY